MSLASHQVCINCQFLPLLVDQQSTLDNAIPSLQCHYSTFHTTTDDSAPVLHSGSIADWRSAGVPCYALLAILLRKPGIKVSENPATIVTERKSHDVCSILLNNTPDLIPIYATAPVKRAKIILSNPIKI